MKWKYKSRNCVQLFVTPCTVALLTPWNSPRKDLPNPGIKPRSPALQADSFLCEPPGKLIAWLVFK